jgi:hypothetical protein
MQVSPERAACEVDCQADAIAVCAAGALVEEDGSGARYGRASRISAACDSLPVRKYSVSSLV